MAITVGSQILSGSISDGSKSVAPTLSADVPAGTATVSEGIWIFPFFIVEDPDPSFTASADNTMFKPTVTDPAEIDDATCYSGLPNLIRGAPYLHWWQYMYNRPFALPDPYTEQRGYAFCGSYFYEVLHDLHSGDAITIDYSHITKDFDLLSVLAWRVSGMRATDTETPIYPVTQPGGSPWGANVEAYGVLGDNCATAGPPPLRSQRFALYTAGWDDVTGTADPTEAFTWEIFGTGVTGIPELGNFNGYIYPDATDSAERVPYHIGFGYHDLGASTEDGEVCSRTDVGPDSGNLNGSFITEGLGWPCETVSPVGVYLPPKMLS